MTWIASLAPIDVTPMLLYGPSSRNVWLNGEAAFDCSTSNVDFVKWFLNETPLDNIKEVVDVSSFVQVDEAASTYSVRFLIQDTNVGIVNNSEISCQGFYNNKLEQHYELTNLSEPALLLVQGEWERNNGEREKERRRDCWHSCISYVCVALLGMPKNLSAIAVEGLLSLNWLPPFTLKGLVVDLYQLALNVNISLGPSNETSTMKIDNTTHQEYLSCEEPMGGICNTYVICVQAESIAGKGERACIINSETKSI